MKTLNLILLMLLCAASAGAQTNATTPTVSLAPGLEVSRNHCQIFVRKPVARNPALDEDPLQAANEAVILDREKKQTMRDNNVRKQLGEDAVPLPTKVSVSQPSQPAARPGAGTRPVATFTYEVTLTNTGEKKIRAVTWEYLFFDRTTHREVGRHPFTSKINLGPGKSKNLSERSMERLTPVVDASQPGEETPGLYAERVVISHIEYEDGTVWPGTSN
jgi:hypothetical protein